MVRKWYQDWRSWLTIVLLLFLPTFLLGLVLMWCCTPWSKKAKWWITGVGIGIPLAVVLIPLVLIPLFQLEWRLSGTRYKSGDSLTPTPQPTVLPSVTLESVMGSYSKRQFDPGEKFFQDHSFPAEIVSKDESDLVSMRCTPELYCPNPYVECIYHQQEADSSVKIVDGRLLALVKAANMTKDPELAGGRSSHDVEMITFCQAENGREFLAYKIPLVGGGAGTADYFGLVLPGDTIEKIGTIQENIAYFSCHRPLQLTKSDSLFYVCGGGDGPSWLRSIYEINFTSKSVERVAYCESFLDEQYQVSETCDYEQ